MKPLILYGLTPFYSILTLFGHEAMRHFFTSPCKVDHASIFICT